MRWWTREHMRKLIHYLRPMTRVSASQVVASDTKTYLSLAAFFLTEFELFWFNTGKRRWTAASILFFFHRYLAILGHIPLYHTFALHSCTAALCLMRISALYNRHRGVLGFLCAIILCTVAVSCLSVFAWHPPEVSSTESLRGCLVFYTNSEAVWLVLTWGGVILFDIAAFGLSVYKGRTLDWRNPLSIAHVMLRDGILVAPPSSSSCLTQPSRRAS
ncbi:hypothetical protein FA95DRAFT_95536 [Auriscalpium vulgare]|uniref:Uncharacterized protein n=1 Tax=Auriscalpium vulgare TaxID=40419 RepID=A0ACB8RQC1_9AGAM|nr:hypothetical protein FA95DRAFT_95536 [Auriscalpium vulgare]